MAIDSQTKVQVTATGPIRHGNANGVVDYAEGDVLELTIAEAKQLLASNSVIASDKVKAAIAEANANVVATEQEVAQTQQPSEQEVAQTLSSVEGQQQQV